jgi:ABC-2 type transport system ATP-binding protein
MPPALCITHLTKTYPSGLQALRDIDLEIRKGEIFALLGPNGAGKTTLISIVCGIVTSTTGSVAVDGHDIVRGYRAARSKIGLVPQELSNYAFETASCSGASRIRRFSKSCCAICRCGTSAAIGS